MLAATLCSFHIGGPVTALIEPRCEGELIESITLCHRLGKRFCVIGRGSNLLFGDGMIETVLIRTTGLDATRLSNAVLDAQCGASLQRLCAIAAGQGFRDLAFACGIPGTLGGAITMNAGAYGKSMQDVVHTVRVFDLDDAEIKTLFNHQLNFSYRNSIFQSKNLVLLSATLSLQQPELSNRIRAEMRALNAARRSAQPVLLPSAGSVFKRPEKDVPLARILDELGLKGMRRGGAEVSRQHAGFIVNLGGATAADVTALICEIQKITERERGIRPEPELRFIPS